MEVNIQVERAAEALDGGDGAGLAAGDPLPARAASIEAAERAHVDPEDRAAERVVPRQHVAQPKREAQHPLPDRDGRQHVIDETGGERLIDDSFVTTFADGLRLETAHSREHAHAVTPDAIAMRRAHVQTRGREQSR